MAAPTPPTLSMHQQSLALLTVADRLASDYDEIATGSVLRCLSRAVRRLRTTGCPPDRLAERAEAATRRMLDRRSCTEVPSAREPTLRLRVSP